MHDILPFFFFNDTATTEIYTLSLHDALPISPAPCRPAPDRAGDRPGAVARAGGHARGQGRRPHQGPRRSKRPADRRDRKSTRLNSSHANISYAVFCLKKKKTSQDLKLNSTYI